MSQATQTRLTADEKQILKNMRKHFGGVLAHFPELGATVAIERTGETMGRFSVALASDAETRYRRKVGAWVVLDRMDAEQHLPVKLLTKEYAEQFGATDAEYMADVAAEIAHTLTCN